MTTTQEPVAVDPGVTQAPGSVLAPPVRSRERRGPKARVQGMIGPTVVFGVVIGIWYFVTYVVLEADLRYEFPPPDQVIHDGFINSYNRSQLLHALLRTAEVTFVGLAISMVLGTLSAVIMVQAKWLENSLYPWAIMLQTVPVLAIIPLISFWFGYGLQSRIIVCVLISFFPIVSNTVFGLQAADRGSHELFTLHKAGRLTRLIKLQLPAALPAMFTGYRVSAGLSVIGAIVGEIYFKQGVAGLGTLFSGYLARLDFAPLFAGVLLSSLLGIAVFLLFSWLNNLVVGRWYRANRG
ncbi:ABC transporter permease [uncultured Jatrophihabitans sp.]|uniref:ABC transporter permease n=1 Tax=uncultured Jatrophihabitans sp. TaxID=1610747 RepID=UPI0035CA2FC5